jgi:hypothetical protein
VYNYLTPTAATPPVALGAGTVLGTNTAVQLVAAGLPAQHSREPAREPAVERVRASSIGSTAQAACTPATNSFCIVGIMPTATSCVHDNKTGLDAVAAATGKPYGGPVDGRRADHPGHQGDYAGLGDHDVESGVPRPGLPAEVGYDLAEQSAGAVHGVLAPPERQVLRRLRVEEHHERRLGLALPRSVGGRAARRPEHPARTTRENGTFGVDGSLTGTGTGTVSGPTSTTTYTFADGSSVTQTTTKNADGSITVDRTYSDGTHTSFVIPPNSGGKQSDTRAKTGRVSWREMIRP